MSNWANVLIIILVALVLRAPLYSTPYWRTNDAMEYINVARNFNAGRGFTLSIKFILSDDAPVVSSALRSRPPLTSLILAGLLKIYNNFYFLQAFNLLLGTLNAILVYLLARKFFGSPVSLVGGLLAATNPNIFITGRLVLSDQLFATFSLFTALVFYQVKNDAGKYLLLGLTTALVALTRLEGIFLVVALSFVSWKKPKEILIMLLSFLLVMLPYFWFNFQANGSPIFSKNVIHYQVRDVREALEGGFEKNLPAPMEFIRHNFSWVVPKVAATTFLHLESLLEFGYFGPLAILLFLALLKNWRKYLPWVMFSTLVILLYSSMWSATFERSRHFIFVYLLLLLPTLEYWKKNLKKPLVLAILLITLAGYLALDIHRIVWARNVDPSVSVWDPPQKANLYSWIKTNTRTSDIIASTNVFMVNLQTERPSITTPTNLNTENFSRFVKKYPVSYFVVVEVDQYHFFDEKAHLVAQFPDGRIYAVNK